MKDKYLYWKRLEKQLKDDIESAEASLYINKRLLITAKSELSKLPIPKPPIPNMKTEGAS